MQRPYEDVVSILSTKIEDRNVADIDKLLPWFRRQSDLFSPLPLESLREIIRNCEFQRYNEDDVVIKQGDKGHSFFIILNGATSIYIASEEEDQDWISPRITDDNENGTTTTGNKNNRLHYGINVGTLGPGSSFGEVALIEQSSLRTATIIADETSDVIVIHRNLYSRILRAAQKKDIDEKQEFIRNHPLFRKWKRRHRSALVLGIRKISLTFSHLLTKQGSPFENTFLIKSGHLVESIQVNVTETDYHLPNLKTKDNEDEDSEDVRSQPVSSKRRRYLGTKYLDIGLLGPNDLVGDIEMLCCLQNNVHTSFCLEPVEAYVVNTNTLHKLLMKRYPDTYNTIQQSALLLLRHRLQRIGAIKLQQYPAIIETIQSLCQPESEEAPTPDINTWLKQRGPLIDDRGPGSLYYRVHKKYKYILEMRQTRELAKNQYNEEKKTEDNGVSSTNLHGLVKEGSSTFNGLVRSESLAQMFQKALNLRANLDKIEEESLNDMINDTTPPNNELYIVDEIRSRRSSKLEENCEVLSHRRSSGSSPRTRLSRMRRMPSGGISPGPKANQVRLIKSAPSSTTSIVYRQFNQQQKINPQRNYTAEDYKYLKDRLRQKEKQHFIHNSWL